MYKKRGLPLWGKPRGLLLCCTALRRGSTLQAPVTHRDSFSSYPGVPSGFFESDSPPDCPLRNARTPAPSGPWEPAPLTGSLLDTGSGGSECKRGAHIAPAARGTPESLEKRVRCVEVRRALPGPGRGVTPLHPAWMGAYLMLYTERTRRPSGLPFRMRTRTSPGFISK